MIWAVDRRPMTRASRWTGCSFRVPAKTTTGSVPGAPNGGDARFAEAKRW